MAPRKKKKKKKFRDSKPSIENMPTKEEVSDLLLQSGQLKNDELMEDLIFLLRSSPESLKNSHTATDVLARAILPTEKMADEPEFLGVGKDLFSCALSFFNIAESIEINWDSFGLLPEPMADSIRQQVLEEVIFWFFTDELRLEVIERLNNYRLKKKQKGKQSDAAVAAALQMVFKDENNKPLWPKIGLLRAMVYNHLGLDLFAHEIFKKYAKNEDIQTLGSKKLDILKNVVFLNERALEIKNYVTRQMEKTMEFGCYAVLEGRLKFGILTIDELNKASSLIIRTIGPINEKQLAYPSQIFSKLADKKQKDLFIALNSFVDEIFTSEKAEQIRKILDDIIKNPGNLRPWMLYLLMLRQDFQSDTPMHSTRSFLIYVTFGEIGSFHGNEPVL